MIGTRPSTMTEFSDVNLEIHTGSVQNMQTGRVRWQGARDVAQRARGGRGVGTEAPVRWRGATVPRPPVLQPPDHVKPIHPLRTGKTAAAVAFASPRRLVESRFVAARIGADLVTMQPLRHLMPRATLAVRWLHRRGHHDLHFWRHDHQSAYRQLLLYQPQMALILLFTEFGPTLWMNHVLLFGATGSVWVYGRFSDFLMHLGRLRLLTAVSHYVDDFHGIETASTAWSAFSGFERLNKLRGCQMKEEKKSPPAAEQHLLGIHLDVSTNEARVGPTDSRRSKLRNLSDNYINAGAISNAEAGSLAGKASCFDSSVGRPLSPLSHGSTLLTLAAV